MKKLLTLMFAVALTLSMSSFVFAQGTSSGTTSSDSGKMDKKSSKKEKTAKKSKKDKKSDDSMKKDDMSKPQ